MVMRLNSRKTIEFISVLTSSIGVSYNITYYHLNKALVTILTKKTAENPSKLFNAVLQYPIEHITNLGLGVRVLHVKLYFIRKRGIEEMATNCRLLLHHSLPFH
jgi:hypothetical protein